MAARVPTRRSGGLDTIDRHWNSLDRQGGEWSENNLLEAGVCREQARGVLPQNMYTQYYGTANLNNLLKFIELRKHAGAQWEMQKVADAVLKICEELFPITVEAWKKSINRSSSTTTSS